MALIVVPVSPNSNGLTAFHRLFNLLTIPLRQLGRVLVANA